MELLLEFILPSLVFLGLLFGAYFLNKRLPKAAVVFGSMAVGIIYGLIVFSLLEESEHYTILRSLFATIGYGYIDLLKMIIVPLVPTSIILSFLNLDDEEKLKKLGKRTIGMFLATATIASVIGIFVGRIFNLGKGVDTTGIQYTGSSQTVETIFKQIRDFIPQSPVSNMANLELVPLIVFALLIAIAAVKVQSKNMELVKPFRDLLNSFLSIVSKLTSMVISLTPYGVLGLTAYWFSYSNGLKSIEALGLFLVAVIVACVLHLVLTYGSIMLFINKLNPIKFIQKAWPATLLAFTSRSSAGTLTVTVDTCKKRLGVSESVSNFVAPIGAVMNMDACGGLYPALVAIFAANAFGVTLSPSQYVILIIVSVFASLGSAGVPMGATIFTTITLAALGLPLDIIAIVAGVDFIVDMFRTSVNVTGDMVTAVTVGKSVGEFDEGIFYK